MLASCRPCHGLDIFSRCVMRRSGRCDREALTAGLDGHRLSGGCYEVDRELVCYHRFTAIQWALNSAVECHLHTSSRFNTFNNLTRLLGTAKYRIIRGSRRLERVLVRVLHQVAESARVWAKAGNPQSNDPSKRKCKDV